ncbi:Ribonuclease kappa-B [Toxocara canis]|uniref:Ribonuclease kappa-B n=2 Tax=Toxocara canis TaxID=6265 RepID=A0A0B2V346_TOXCA|nr:Ribonuclease kappa-B [Toxocara canis]
MPKICPLCGPKLSAFCMVMSVWGVIFLGLLGVFFYIQAVSLFPDLHFGEEEAERGVVPPLTNAIIADKYGEKATQCWVAAGMYLVTLIVVFWQNKFNTTSIF